MRPPNGVLLCPPDFFDVVDVKNPFMEGRVGTVDRAAARAQWEALAGAFAALGLRVETIAPTPGCEDMVFCANQAFTGPGACVLSRMRHAARQREVPAFRAWFLARGDRVVEARAPFEGGGDAIWHPDGSFIWGGVGPRTSGDAYPLLEETFGVAVERVELATPEFYHLDTCFCPLDADTVLVYPPALADLEPLRARFARVLEAGAEDARARLACNAAAWDGHVVIQRGCDITPRLRALGYDVVEVETGEFLKSGGSVYCLKQWLY